MMLLSLGEVVVTVYPPHLTAKAYESEEVGRSRATISSSFSNQRVTYTIGDALTIP